MATIDYSNTARVEAMRRAYASGAAGLQAMLDRAERLGRQKVSGYTVEELRAGVAEYTRLSKLDRDGLMAHLAECRTRVLARLKELN